MKKVFILISLIVSGILIISCAGDNNKTFTKADINIIPMPNQIDMGQESFSLSKGKIIAVSDASLNQLAQNMAQQLKELTALEFKSGSNQNDVGIQLVLDETLNSEEGYDLQVSQQGISIKAKSTAGIQHATQTLYQLLHPIKDVNQVKWIVPSVAISDAPRFAYRGLMLDVSRHFFDKAFVLKTLDAMAMHKLNTLHLHLIDDQGWRIEIKKYPKLTEVGAWRNDREDRHWNDRKEATTDNEKKYGGYYTQEDLKEIVAYAQSLQIEVIPEIEMPAHVMSAIASYPELSCKGNAIAVPSGGVWPITDIYCAGKENTFQFLEDVLDEVVTIFPSKYIHIGGDEATKTNWESCPHCKKRMRDENLHDVEELQSYFVKRMERYINAKGKKLIGWDEILEGGLAPDATVMSWRGTKGGVEAAKEGHDVIMTPTGHCYFDYYQGPQELEPLAIGGYLPLRKVYTFDPVVEGMSEEEAAHVVGGQANLWT